MKEMECFAASSARYISRILREECKTNASNLLDLSNICENLPFYVIERHLISKEQNLPFYFGEQDLIHAMLALALWIISGALG